MRFTPPLAPLLVLLAAGVAGCAGVSVGWPIAAAIVALAVALGVACGSTTDLSRDAPQPDGGLDAAPVDATGGDAAEGTWEPCCVEGKVETCYCPPNTACNYGWMTVCDDGSCTYGTCSVDAGAADTGAGTDAGCAGNWEACCVEGEVSTCCCPPNMACNYGWFTYCTETTCVWPNETCPDGGAPDAGGG